MTGYVIAEKPTNRFLGQCADCVRPVAIESATILGTHTMTECAECAKPVKAIRLVAVTSADYCDGSCMSAVGPNCSCACGGVNHGVMWVGGPRRFTTLQLAEALETHRKKTAAKKVQTEKARAKRAETKRQAAEREFTEWRDSLPEADQDLVDWLRVYENVDFNGFLVDMRLNMITDPQGRRPARPLTPNQLAACRRIVEREAERAKREAEEAANAKPAPLGKAITVEGVVVHTKYQENPFGPGGQAKMLVLGDGWKVWATIPQNLIPVISGEDDHYGLKGVRIQFIADVALSERDPDPTFAIAKRPRKAVRLPAAA